MRNKVIIAVFSRAGEQRALSRIGTLIQGNNDILILSKEPASNLTDKMVTSKQFDDYLTDEEIDAVERDVLKFMEGLPRSSPEFADAIAYEEISLLEVRAFHIFQLFFNAFKYVKATRKAIGMEKPHRLIVFGGKESILFWRNIEQALNQRTILRKLASWVANSRITTLEEEVVIEVARNMGITVERSQNGIGANLRHSLFSRMLPMLFQTFIRLSDSRRSAQKRILDTSNKATTPRNKICLFVSSRNVSLSAAPIIKELRRGDSKDVLVVGVDSPMTSFVRGALSEQGIPFQAYETYIDVGVKRKTAAGAKSLKRKWEQIQNNAGFQKLISYDGLPLWQVLKDRLSLSFAMLLPEAIKHIEVAKHIIESEKPDIFVLMDELSSWERAVAFAARLKGIPTLNVQSMAYGSRESPISISTDRVTVSGELMKQMAIKRKGEAYRDRLIITGDPRYEYNLQAVRNFNPVEFKQKLGLKEDRNIIVFTSTPVQLVATAELRERLLRCVYNAIKELPDKQFVVKLHPGEDFDLHYQLKQEMKLESVVIIKDINLYHLLSASDLLMTFFSTTAVEAMLLDKPVIEINLTGKADSMPYVERGAALGVYREEDLVPAIKEVLNHKDIRSRLAEARKRYVYDYAYLQDGKVSQRIITLIEEMIKEKTAS